MEDMRDQAMLLRPARPDSGEGLLFARYLDEAAEALLPLEVG